MLCAGSGYSRQVRRGPLADSYPGAVALVVSSLVPYLALTAAVFPLATKIGAAVGLRPHAMDLTIGLSTGAYAAGTVFAVQLAVHLPARRMLVIYEVLFVAASAVAAWAPSGLAFAIAFVAQGLCTSLMLIAAVPPLVTGWPAKKMPVTAAVMNLCIFGAVAAGPTVGAALAAHHVWRPLFVTAAAIAAVALGFSLLTYEDDPPQDTTAPWDLTAIALTALGCGAAFFGAGELQATLTASLQGVLPLAAGFALLVALVVYQYSRRNPLMPVRSAATTVPLTGLFVALSASAAAIGLMEILLQALKTSSTPTRTAELFLPELVGAIVVAGIFGLLFRTRYTPLLAFSGLLAITAAAGLLIATLPRTGPLTAIATGVLGAGVAASVSPALFMVGFSLRSEMLQRLFAMIELLRGVTGFLVAPVLLFLAGVVASTANAGLHVALWICLGLAVSGFVGATWLYTTGKGRLEVPNLERWQANEDPAWESPALGRRGRVEQVEELPGKQGQAA